MNECKPSSVDLFKLICSLFVVCIHTQVLTPFHPFINWFITHALFRLAVPYFFIAGGYFLGIKLLPVAEDKILRMNICRDYIKKNLPMFLFWSSIGLFNYIISMLQNGFSISITYIIKIILFYPMGAMWFLLASMVAVLIICLLWDYKNILCFVAIIGYCFALMATSYYFLIDGTLLGAFVKLYLQYFISARNGINVGLIYIGIGIYLSEKNNYIRKLCLKNKISIFAILYIVLCIEIIFTYGKRVLDDSSCFIILPMMSMFLFLISLDIKMNYSYALSVHLRKISVYIYCMHYLLKFIMGIIPLKILQINIIQFLLIIFICVLFYYINTIKKNKFVSYVLR